MERLTVKWTDKVYDTLDPVDILDNEYSKTNYNKLLTKLGEYEDFEEIFREKMTDTACEFLKDKEEFSKWLDRTEWIVRKCDEYARAEEQGLLLKLPCKIGSIVYVVGTKCLKGEELIGGCGKNICDGCILNETYTVFETDADTHLMKLLLFEHNENFIFNKTVFLTREEAEKALERLECVE